MRVTLVFDGCSTEQLRRIAALCSRERDAWTTGSWRPRVNCEGPECFGVKVDPVSPGVAHMIISELTADAADQP